MDETREATARPWVALGRYIGTKSHMSVVGECRDINGNWSNAAPATANAALIVQAVNDRDALIAKCDALREALEQIQSEAEATDSHNISFNKLDRIRHTARAALSQFCQETK